MHGLRKSGRDFSVGGCIRASPSAAPKHVSKMASRPLATPLASAPGTTKVSAASAPRPEAAILSAVELSLSECGLEELFAKDARRAAGVLAEIHSHTAPLHAAFAAYATEALPSKRKSAKSSAERPAVLSYTAWCRFAADRRLPKKIVKASTEHIYARSESLEGTAGRKPSEGHLLFAEFVGGLVRLALQQHKALAAVVRGETGLARSRTCGPPLHQKPASWPRALRCLPKVVNRGGRSRLLAA